MKELQWHEPTAYRRAIYFENERHDPLNSLKFAGTTFLLFLGFRLLVGTGSQGKQPPPWWPHTIAAAAAVAIFVAYVLPALMSVLPGSSIVLLSDKGVNNNKMAGRGWVIRFWSWDEIAYGVIATDTAGGKAYPVMSLHAVDGSVLVTLALPASPPAHEVWQYFAAHGKVLEQTYQRQ